MVQAILASFIITATITVARQCPGREITKQGTENNVKVDNTRDAKCTWRYTRNETTYTLTMIVFNAANFDRNSRMEMCEDSSDTTDSMECFTYKKTSWNITYCIPYNISMCNVNTTCEWQNGPDIHTNYTVNEKDYNYYDDTATEMASTSAATDKKITQPPQPAGMIGGAASVAVVLVLIIVIAMIFIHKKRRKMRPEDITMKESRANPVYEGGMELTQPYTISSSVGNLPDSTHTLAAENCVPSNDIYTAIVKDGSDKKTMHYQRNMVDNVLYGATT